MPYGRTSWLSGSGINTTRYKLLAFCLSGFFAGISGRALCPFHEDRRALHPGSLYVFHRGHLVRLRRGGHHIRSGGVPSLFSFRLLEFFRFWPEYRTLMFAVVILLILLYMPEGFFPWVRDKIETECPRCKIRNVATRKTCRICTAPLD